MEQRYKVRYLLVVCGTFLLAFALLNWYGTINREKVKKINKKEYLSFDEAKVAALDHDPSREYYFEIEYTELTKKSYIPFVYNSEPITEVNKQLMSRPH